jgi:diguanylate cyclase (GGDEF)-like protein
MAASQQQRSSEAVSLHRRATQFLSRAGLIARLEEEINRAGRHATALCCLLVQLDDLKQIERVHGGAISQELVDYTSTTLRCEFRRFDRLGEAGEGEFMALLPGADGLRSEIVARRVLRRLRAIKIEADDRRQPMRISVSLAVWREGLTAEGLIAQARSAAAHEQLGFMDAVRV